jgi:hypothetical protein
MEPPLLTQITGDLICIGPAVYWRYQAWLLAEFFGAQNQVAELNDHSRLRLDIAGAPRKLFWKIDYYSNLPGAFGAKGTFDITLCYRVLSS